MVVVERRAYVQWGFPNSQGELGTIGGRRAWTRHRGTSPLLGAEGEAERHVAARHHGRQ